jgi:hypothetical protein
MLVKPAVDGSLGDKRSDQQARRRLATPGNRECEAQSFTNTLISVRDACSAGIKAPTFLGPTQRDALRAIQPDALRQHAGHAIRNSRPAGSRVRRCWRPAEAAPPQTIRNYGRLGTRGTVLGGGKVSSQGQLCAENAEIVRRRAGRFQRLPLCVLCQIHFRGIGVGSRHRLEGCGGVLQNGYCGIETNLCSPAAEVVINCTRRSGSG